MELIHKLQTFAKTIPDMKCQIDNESATILSLVNPFFNILGYSIFDPREFRREYTATVADRNKQEKVDIAILIDNKPQIIVEAKHHTEDLNKDAFRNQLGAYFVAVEAKFGVLTNGIEYKFFTCLNKPHKMDKEPFLEFNILEIEESVANELKPFAKETVDMDGAFEKASELKYMNKIKELFGAIRTNPSDDFTKYVMGAVYDGSRTQTKIEEFKDIIKRAFKSYISDIIGETAESFMSSSAATENTKEEITPVEGAENYDDVVRLTDEERDAFVVVKSILKDAIEPARLTNKRLSCGSLSIQIDNNHLKFICRVKFVGRKKKLGYIDESGKWIFEDISCPFDINTFSDRLIYSCKKYL